MMGYGYNDGGVWMWVFGGLMMVGVLDDQFQGVGVSDLR